MTPLTFDMAFLGKGQLSHRGSLSLEVYSDSDWKTVSWSQLSLHRSLLPLLYLSENLSDIEKTMTILEALCLGLRKDLSFPLISFQLKEKSPLAANDNLTQRIWHCPK